LERHSLAVARLAIDYYNVSAVIVAIITIFMQITFVNATTITITITEFALKSGPVLA
jgi:hypothetical protein